MALAGFALLTCGDAIIKSMAGMWPAPAIAALRFSIAVPLLASFVAATQGDRRCALQSHGYSSGEDFRSPHLRSFSFSACS